MKELAEELTPLAKAISAKDNELKLRETYCNDWRHIARPGVTKERLEEPSYWSAVAGKFRPYDEVTVIAGDRTSISRWVVLQCGRNYAELLCLSWHQLPAMLANVAETLPSNHAIKFDVEAGWFALRLSDSIVVTKGHKSQADCLAALLQHASLQ